MTLQPFLSLSVQVIQRVAERLEDAGVQHANIGQIVKKQFAALVEGHYLQRVRPPHCELMNISHGDQRTDGVSNVPVHRRFELPLLHEGECDLLAASCTFWEVN